MNQLNNRIYASIDTGWSGALAYYCEQTGKVVAVKCPPTLGEIMVFVEDLAEEWKDHAPYVYLERVGPRPGNGLKATWSFSENYTTWQCALIAAKIPYETVPPKRWMKKTGITLSKEKKKRKNQLKAHAQRLYPHIRATLANADALCMLSTMYTRTQPDEIERLLS